MDNQPPQIPTPINLEASSKKVPSLLGTLGLSLALFGVILSVIPMAAIFGFLALLAAFILCLIALFKKNTAKWPAIVGLVVSVIAGIIVSVIFVVALLVNLAGDSDNNRTNTPAASQESNSSSDEVTSGDRPNAQALASGIQKLAHEGGNTSYDNKPDFYPCMGEYFYASKLSNDALSLVAAGKDITGAERELAIETSTNASLACDQ